MSVQKDHVFLYEIFIIYVTIGIKWGQNVLVPRYGISAVVGNKKWKQ